MFALREVPHSSTGFSPAELVFGRKMRGLLNVARETWTGDDDAGKQLSMPTVRYMEELSHKIESALKTARQNVENAQLTMKENFDKTSSIRELQPGDLALVLLPTSGNKLLAKWQGPVNVLRRCENNNYEVQIGRRKATMHINSLRKFYERQNCDDSVTTTLMVVTDDNNDEIQGDSVNNSAPLQADTAGDANDTTDFVLGSQLTTGQRADMHRLLSNYNDVLTDKPGRTNLVQHQIRVTDRTPCYQPPYRIPESLRAAVYDELMAIVFFPD